MVVMDNRDEVMIATASTLDGLMAAGHTGTFTVTVELFQGSITKAKEHHEKQILTAKRKPLKA